MSVQRPAANLEYFSYCLYHPERKIALSIEVYFFPVTFILCKKNVALIEECDSLVGVSFMHTDISLLVVLLVLMCRRH